MQVMTYLVIHSEITVLITGSSDFFLLESLEKFPEIPRSWRKDFATSRLHTFLKQGTNQGPVSNLEEYGYLYFLSP